MQTVQEYIKSTETAVRQLFDGLGHYSKILKEIKKPMYVSDYPNTGFSEEYEDWFKENRAEIERAFEREQEYVAEIFSQSTLAGTILIVAAKALEVYSKNTDVPDIYNFCKGPKIAKYCVGREIRGIKLGLIIYAARNQHSHYNEEGMRSPNREIIDTLAREHGYRSEKKFIDPAFDLTNPNIGSISNNVLSLICWRNFNDYRNDILNMCKI